MCARFFLIKIGAKMKHFGKKCLKKIVLWGFASLNPPVPEILAPTLSTGGTIPKPQPVKD